MGKRSNFTRVPRDFYPTPYKAIIPLLPHLDPHTRFAEPCAGNGALIRHLEKHGHLLYWGSDIEDRSEQVPLNGVMTMSKYAIADALTLTVPLQQADCIITNTPWERKILHVMIKHFRKQNSAWLLLDTDYAFTKQSSEYMQYCSKIVAVGRVKWIEGSKNSGKENAAWYKFEQEKCTTEFIGRQPESSELSKPVLRSSVSQDIVPSASLADLR